MKFLNAEALSINFILLRKRLGLTQKEFADKAGISRLSVIHIENNDHNVKVNTVVSMLGNVETGGIESLANFFEVVEIDDRFIPADYLDGALSEVKRWTALKTALELYGSKCLKVQEQ